MDDSYDELSTPLEAIHLERCGQSIQQMQPLQKQIPRGAYHKIYPQLKLSARQIRLLTIRQRDCDHNDRRTPVTVLEASLRVVSLDNAPPYCAMSHTWGEQILTHAITVNGKLLSIMRNCWEALQFHRDHWSSTETVTDENRSSVKAEAKLKAFQRRFTRGTLGRPTLHRPDRSKGKGRPDSADDLRNSRCCLGLDRRLDL